MTDEPPERKQLELCSYKIDKENSLGVFTLNRCEMSQEYTDRLLEFFSAVRDNNIGNIAVDYNLHINQGPAEAGPYDN